VSRQFIQLIDHGMGVNIMDPSHLLPPNQYRRMKNCHSYQRGPAVKRRGTVAYNSTAISGITRMAVGGLHRFYTLATVDKELITAGAHTSNDKVYVENSSANGFDELTGGSTLTLGQSYSFVTFRDTAFGTGTGLQSVFYHLRNTTTKANIEGSPAPPTGGLLEIHGDGEQLYITMDSSNPGRVHYSNGGLFATLPTTLWHSSNFFDVAREQGDKVTGIAYWEGAMHLFTNRSIHVQTGIFGDDGDAGNHRITDYTNVEGCDCPYSVAKTPYGVVYAGKNGIFLWTGGPRPSRISYNIQPIFDDSLDLETGWKRISVTNIEDFVGEYDKQRRQYRFSYTPTGESTQSVELVCQLDRVDQKGDRVWWGPYEGPEICAYAIQDGPGDDGRIMIADPTEGKVFRYENGTNDDGSDINMVVKARDALEPDVRLLKRIEEFQAEIERHTGSSTLTLDTDFLTRTSQFILANTAGTLWGDGLLWGTFNWASSGRERFNRHVKGLKGSHWSYKFEDTSQIDVSFIGLSMGLEALQPR